MRARLYAGVFAALFAVASCGGGDSGPTGTTNPGGSTGGGGGGGGSTSNSITVSNNSFSPSSTTVPVGTTVTWTWASGSDLHNVTFPSGQSSQSQSSGTFSRTFGAAGTFNYTCTLHVGMNGTVTVQ